MARVVEQGREARRSSLLSYPWQEWTDGQRREAFHGDDFAVSLKSFRLYLYQYKNLINHGLVPQPGEDQVPKDQTRVRQWKVETDIVETEGSVQFRFVPLDEYVDHSY